MLKSEKLKHFKALINKMHNSSNNNHKLNKIKIKRLISKIYVFIYTIK